MKLCIVLAGLLLCAAQLSAETYSWVDEHGTYNYTEDYSRVPKKYRSKVVKQGDMGASPVSKESVPQLNGSGITPPPDPNSTAAGKLKPPVGSFGGKSYDQWQQELSEREAAMLVVRKRIDEIDALLKNKPSQGLILEHNKVVEQFNEMRKQYDQQVELARKAGLQVNITK